MITTTLSQDEILSKFKAEIDSFCNNAKFFKSISLRAKLQNGNVIKMTLCINRSSSNVDTNSINGGDK